MLVRGAGASGGGGGGVEEQKDGHPPNADPMSDDAQDVASLEEAEQLAGMAATTNANGECFLRGETCIGVCVGSFGGGLIQFRSPIEGLS